MSKIVEVKKEECTSCEACSDSLPKFFRVDEDSLAESHNNGENINNAEVPVENCDSVQDEIDQCPGECINWK